MKKILAATDFSKVSRNAVNHAAELARKSKAELVLFNAFYPLVIPAEGVIVAPNLDEFRQDSEKRLKRISAGLKRKYGQSLKIECVSVCGTPESEIEIFASKNKVDLIVMGMQGGNWMNEKIFGGVTTSFLKHTTHPTLVVPKGVKFHPIRKIVFATDYGNIPSYGSLDTMMKMSNLWKAKILVFHLNTSSQKKTIGEEFSGFTIERILKKTKHSFYEVKGSDIPREITSYANSQKAELVTLMPREHDLAYRIFHRGNTRQMAFRSKIPLLTIPNTVN
jgi:nucleotide-binding universal stress UspA family protein